MLLPACAKSLSSTGPEMDTDESTSTSGDSSVETDSETGRVSDTGTASDFEEERPDEWQWVFEDFEKDFSAGEIDRYDWRTEGGNRLDIVQDDRATRLGADNASLLAVSAIGGDVSMLKMSDIAGGRLPKVTLCFHLNVTTLFAGEDEEFSVAAFRDGEGEAIGLVRILRVDSSEFDLAIRRNGETSPKVIRLSMTEWYKVTFSYDANAASSLTLEVTDSAFVPVGSVSTDAATSSVETVQLGKVDYAAMGGDLLMDDVSIWVPKVSDLWVSTDGDDDASGFSTDTSLKTIQRAADKAGPGTVIHVLPGTYRERATFRYAGSNPTQELLRLHGEGDLTDAVIIDGTDIEFNWGGLLEAQHTSYLAFLNLTVTNSAGFGVFVDQSDHIEVDNLKTDTTAMSSVYVGESSHIEIAHVEAYRACLLDSEGIAAQENISLLSVSDFVVRDCLVHGGKGNDNGGEGICVKGYSDQGRIYRNRVFDLPDDVGIYIGVGSEDPARTTHHILVYQNEVTADAGIALSSEYGGTVEDVDIFNNIVHGGAYGGIQVTKWQNDPSGVGAIGMRKRIRIFNNTVVGVGKGGVGGGIHLQCDDPAHLEDIEIFNNIASGNFSGQLVVPDAVYAVVSLSNNLIDGEGGISADDAICKNCVGEDPMFVGDGEMPFELRVGSPAIDTGKDAWVDMDFDGASELLPMDFFERTRPAAVLDLGQARYDMGALEFSP